MHGPFQEPQRSGHVSRSMLTSEHDHLRSMIHGARRGGPDAALRMPNREHSDLVADRHIVDMIACPVEEQTACMEHRRPAV